DYFCCMATQQSVTEAFQARFVNASAGLRLKLLRLHRTFTADGGDFIPSVALDVLGVNATALLPDRTAAARFTVNAHGIRHEVVIVVNDGAAHQHADNPMFVIQLILQTI